MRLDADQDLCLRERGQAVYLNLQAMKRLDQMILRSYAEWITGAPEEYKTEDMFSTRKPVTITSIFGQNQELASSVELRNEEHDNWERDRDYARIRYLTLVLATHIRSVFPHVSQNIITHCLSHMYVTEQERSGGGKNESQRTSWTSLQMESLHQWSQQPEFSSP
jgi:hypothetical protein